MGIHEGSTSTVLGRYSNDVLTKVEKRVSQISMITSGEPAGAIPGNAVVLQRGRQAQHAEEVAWRGRHGTLRMRALAAPGGKSPWPAGAGSDNHVRRHRHTKRTHT